jgi:uncharacterized protein YqhQ
MPGGFVFRKTGGVHERALSVLGQADAATSLPRLGGMARPDGVVVVSERFWALARTDGTLVEGVMPSPPAALARVPLVRGLVRLGLSLSPLFRRGGVARRREQWPLVAALGAPLGFAFLAGAVALVVQVVVALGLVFWLLRGRTLRLHGAEHRAIAAAERRSLLATWDGAERPSRFSPRCGTNFAALVLPVALALNAVWPLGTAMYTPLAVTLVSLALAMEVWRIVQASPGGALRVLLWPGLALQRVTTREPALAETRVALRAVASVLVREGQ